MSQVPIKNSGKTVMHVANVLIPPGETKVFDAADLPPHMQPARGPAPLPTEPDDPLLELLDENVPEIVKAIQSRGADGTPELSNDDLIRLGEAEANGKTRKGLMNALDKERMRRADEAQQGEDHAVFVESLKDMGAEQLGELRYTHKEDPAKVEAIDDELASRDAGG